MIRRHGLQSRAATALLTLLMGLAISSQAGALTLYPFIEATDAISSFDSGTGVYTTSVSGDAVLVQPASVVGKTLTLDLVLSGSETVATIGTRFVGSGGGGADLYLKDGATVLLSAVVDDIFVSNIVPGAPGSTFTSVNIGDLDPNVGAAELTITGGTLAGTFGGAGTVGRMFMLVNKPNKYFFPGSVFSTSFTAQSNIQIQFIPEPGTFLLVGASVLGLAFHRRRLRSS